VVEAPENADLDDEQHEGAEFRPRDQALDKRMIFH
jgi:hypothetical protein